MGELKTVDTGASGTTRESDGTLFADNDHASGGHMVKCALLAGVVTCRTSAPSVKHIVRAHVPSNGPVGVAFDKAMSVAIAADYLRCCALLCFP